MTSPNGGASDWTGVTPQFAVGDVVARRYRIEAFIRQDLFGSIYLVRHTRYGQALTLKAFHPFHFSDDGDFETLQANFKKAKSVSHAGAGRYLEVGEVEGVRYVTMERVEGKSLRQLLDEYRQSGLVLPLKEAKTFLIQIVEILEGIHGESPHGNLNPDKILLPARIKPGLMGESSDVKLLDFALLEVNAAATGDLALAPGSEVCYSPPELIQYGGLPSDSADVYGVAAIFYEMLTGARPLEGREPPSTIRGDIPEEVDYFLEQALHHNPSERLSMSAMAQRLRSLPDEKGEDDDVALPTSKAFYVLIALLLIAGAIGVWYATRDEEIPPEVIRQNESNRLRNQVREGGWNSESPEEFEAHREAAPKGMTYVPAGKALLGPLPTELENVSPLEPEPTVVDMKGYYIDVFDHPNRKKAVATGSVTWDEAVKLCADEGKRLCTADEWERACKGPSAEIYPYGDAYDATICATSKKKDLESGAYPECRSEFKVADMAGGAWEWTSTVSPANPSQRIVKGGYDVSEPAGNRCAFRNSMPATASYSYLSLRCCQDVASPAPEGEDPEKDKK